MFSTASVSNGSNVPPSCNDLGIMRFRVENMQLWLVANQMMKTIMAVETESRQLKAFVRQRLVQLQRKAEAVSLLTVF